MAADELGGDDEAEAGAALARAAAERLEQVVARLLRQAGAGVGDADLAARRRPRRRRSSRVPGRPVGLDRLGGVAHQVREHAEQLVGVGAHAGPAPGLGGESTRRAAAWRSFSTTSATSGPSAKTSVSGGSSSALPKVSVRSQSVIARGERGDELRGGAPDRRVVAGLDPVGEELGGRQDVAQVVADLGDRAAERRQPLLLAQRRGQPDLSSCSAVSASRSSRAPLAGAMMPAAFSGRRGRRSCGRRRG